jgi:hypothetical protein
MAVVCRRGAFLLASLMAAALFVVARIHSLSVYVGADLAQLVQGGAHIPYQYRVLIPAVVKGISDLDLVPLCQLLCAPLNLSSLATALDTTIDVAAPFVVFEILSAWGIIYSFRALMREFVSSEVAALGGVGALLSLLYALPLLTEESRFWYPSDMPAVLLVILAYHSLFHGRVGLFYPLFLLGTFNRESTVFLLPVLLFLPARLEKKGWETVHATLLLGCWLAIKWLLFQLFRGNPGYPLHPNIFVNLELLHNSMVLAVTVIGLTVLLLLYWRVAVRLHDARLRSAFFGVATLLLCTFFVGKWDEMRVYLECVPLVVIALTASLAVR